LRSGGGKPSGLSNPTRFSRRQVHASLVRSRACMNRPDGGAWHGSIDGVNDRRRSSVAPRLLKRQPPVADGISTGAPGRLPPFAVGCRPVVADWLLPVELCR
jgi:hypothetical protein